jgi:hypothetical protein
MKKSRREGIWVAPVLAERARSECARSMGAVTANPVALQPWVGYFMLEKG